MLEQNQIFIHVPKTGGTTLNCTLHGTEHPQGPSYNYRHIDDHTKLSNSGDIFNPLKNEKYRDAKIFMMLRHPVDRILSEYYFIKERNQFFSLLNPQPRSFKEYALHRQSANYVVSFLLGNQIYSKKRPNKEDLELVINGIRSLDISIGLFEEFGKSLDMFERQIGISWPRVIENKRVTIIRPEKEEVSQALARQIEKHHALDLELYNFAKDKFATFKNLNPSRVKFKENRYDYVLTYANNHFILEMVLKDHAFIAQHRNYFNDLRRYLSTKNLKSGEEYLELWKAGFTAALLENKLDLSLKLLIESLQESHPEHFIKKFGKFIKDAKAKQLEGVHLSFNRLQIPSRSIVSRIWNRLKS